MFNKIKEFFKKKSIPYFIISELSLKQLQYLNSSFEYLFPYLHRSSIIEIIDLIRTDLKLIQEGKSSQYLNYTSISASEVRLMLNFEQLSLLYLPACLAYPDWDFGVEKGRLSQAISYVRDFGRGLYQLTHSFTKNPVGTKTNIRITLSEDEFRHLYTNVVWYTMTDFRYINFGKDIEWNWDELFTLLLEEVSYIGLKLFPQKLFPTQTQVFDLDSRMKWYYPMDFLESVASALKNYRVASIVNSKNCLLCTDCLLTWENDAIQPILKCPKCEKSLLNPFYLNRVKDKELSANGTWCIAYEKNSDNGVTLSLNLEYFFMLLIAVLTSPSFMHAHQETLVVFDFEKDAIMKKLFIEALCNLLENR